MLNPVYTCRTYVDFITAEVDQEVLTDGSLAYNVMLRNRAAGVEMTVAHPETLAHACAIADAVSEALNLPWAPGVKLAAKGAR